jgi:surfactin synthase thioesterase subunit
MGKIAFYDWTEINRLAVASKGMHACYVDGLDDSGYDILVNEVKKRYPLKDHNVTLVGMLMGGMVFFDTKKELDKFFGMFMVDGVYGSGIYACTYSPSGEFITENT